MTSFFQSSKYSAINTEDPTIMGYYIVKYVSEAFALNEYIINDRKVSSTVELALQAEYLGILKANKNWYWEQK